MRGKRTQPIKPWTEPRPIPLSEEAKVLNQKMEHIRQSRLSRWTAMDEYAKRPSFNPSRH